MSRNIRRERFSLPASLFTAILLFPVALLIAEFVMSAILQAAYGIIRIIADFSEWLYDLISLTIDIGLPIFIAYLASRIVYINMRWQFIKSDGRYCENCEYDLTGNVSGRCPECGSTVVTREPADAAIGEGSSSDY